MSGPKCIKIEPTAEYLEREKTRMLCEASLSELRRLWQQQSSLARQVSDLDGAFLLTEMEPYDALERRVRSLLEEGRHDDAGQACKAGAAQARRAVAEIESILARCQADLQRRHLVLGNGCTRLVKMREQIATFGFSNSSEACSLDTLEKLSSARDRISAEVIIPTLPKLEFNAESLAAIQRAEHRLAAAIQALETGRLELTTLMDNAHKRSLYASLAPRTSDSATISDWLSACVKSDPVSPSFDVRKETENLLTSVSALSSAPIWPDLLQRVDLIERDPNPDHQRVLLDNLKIQCSREINQLREKRRWEGKVFALIDEGAPWPEPQVEQIVVELRAIQTLGKVDDLSAIEVRLHTAIETARQRARSADRRRALIESLEEMGYAVTEGLETATVSKGRLIFQQGSAGNYAVEVLSSDDPPLVQTTLVRYSDTEATTALQRATDKEKEEAWCHDHARLRKKLAERGWSASMMLETPAGQKAVKVIKFSSKEARRKKQNSQGGSRQVGAS